MLVSLGLLLLALSGLSLLVLVHELGHFSVARLFKMAVSRFSIGFGPILFRRRFGETDYTLNAIPAGGSVRVLGEPGAGGGDYRSELEALRKGRSREELRELLRRDRRIRYKSPLQQFLLAFAGPVASIALGFALLTTLNIMVGRFEEVAGAGVRVASVVVGSPAENAGIRAGDSILKVNDVAVGTVDALLTEMSLAGDTLTRIQVARGSDTLNLDLTPRMVKDDLLRVERPQIGVQLQYGEVIMQKTGIFEGMQLGAVDTGNIIALQLRGLGRLFTGQLPLSSLSGPVGIIHSVGVTAMFGVASFVSLLALLSITVGTMNLLPILPLDGGRMLFSAIEGLRKRPVPYRVQMSASLAGLALLVSVGLIAFINDISRLS